jgi:hypothetical protein
MSRLARLSHTMHRNSYGIALLITHSTAVRRLLYGTGVDTYKQDQIQKERILTSGSRQDAVYAMNSLMKFELTSELRPMLRAVDLL